VYNGYKFLQLYYDDDNGTERSFMPNARMDIGVGIAVYNTIIGLDLGAGVRMQDKQKYGKTRSFDFQVHHYNRRFVVDLYVQRYQGFYEEQGKDIFLHPDLRVTRLSLHSHYVWNHRKFSYKAAFAQTERQIRSAGSWLSGAEYYKTRIRSDEPLTNEGHRRSNNFQIGINGGYAYTWALGKYWNLGVAGTMGVAFGNEAFEDSWKKSVAVYPVVCPRFSAVYDRRDWALAVSYAGSLLLLPTNEKGSMNIHSGNGKWVFIYRFGKGVR